ncbi:MAG: serine/threonine-protein kinase [Myxococcota bacterium]
MSELVVLGPVGSGGTGTVELAFRYEGMFRRAVAVKRLHDVLSNDELARAAFVKEARLAGRLRHPNVVGVLDVGSDERGAFLVMDYVAGVTLKRFLELVAAPLPVQVALEIGVGVARGLWAAHRLRVDGRNVEVIHRDVTPSNVLVSFDGAVRLSDFGLAKAAEDPRTRELLRGTSGYMAPEQLRFEELDCRADLFSLGVVLFEMLSGERLYGGDDANAAARRILNEPPPRLSPELGVPPGAVQVVSQLLAKSPEQRPESALVVVRALEAARRTLVTGEGPRPLYEYSRTVLADDAAQHRVRLSRWESERSGTQTVQITEQVPRRRFWLFGGAVVAALVAAVAISFGVVRDRPAGGGLAQAADVGQDAGSTLPDASPDAMASADSSLEREDAVGSSEDPEGLTERRPDRPRRNAGRMGKVSNGMMRPLWDW